MKALKKILQIGICLFMVVGLGNNAFGQADREKTLNEIQNQIISLRNEFKLRIQKAEQDRLAIYEHIQTKLEDLITNQQSLNTSYPEFKEKVEELASLLDMYSGKIATLEQVLDTMESTMNQNLDTIEMQLANIKQQGLQKSPTPQPEPSPSFDFAPGELFRAVYRVYMDGDYEIAIAGFQKYLMEYQNTQLAGAAQYWIAESFAKLEEYETAVEEYDRLIKKYPQDDKVADAYYGKGIALLRLEKPAEANFNFTYLVEHFPGTVAAKKADNRLKELR